MRGPQREKQSFFETLTAHEYAAAQKYLLELRTIDLTTAFLTTEYKHLRITERAFSPYINTSN
jgi:hypothetical protein